MTSPSSSSHQWLSQHISSTTTMTAAAVAAMRFVVVILVVLLHADLIHSNLVNDRASLVAFFAQTQHSSRKFQSWNTSVSVCQWRGVTCDGNQTSVTVLRLPGVGLSGPIPPSTLSLLSTLRVLSLRSNRLSGPIPADFVNLTLLRSLYLHKNRLSGGIPTDIARMRSLKRLDLSSNELTGEIPVGIGGLKELTGLFLEDNKLTGNIPRMDDLRLEGFDVSNNRLGGEIPESLDGFPVSSFAGNLNLCGRPLPPCFPSPPPAPTAEFSGGHHGKLSRTAIIGISIASGVVILLLLLILLVCLISKRRRRSGGSAGTKAKSTAATTIGTETTSSKDERSRGLSEATEKNKLVFFENSPYSFDLEDLLRASAEVLGKGTLGTSYKAVLEDGSVVLVKRLKDVTAAKREFEQQMEVLGKVRHENVVPLRAYYFSKDEKLLVSDHLPAGSLSAFLHGSRMSGRAVLDWSGRVRIAFSAAKGLSHLHSSNIVHGDVKGSNILLRSRPDGTALSDFGLWVLFRKAAVGIGIAYRAPEVAESGKATVESDIYGFGVVLLELLTGKAANQLIIGEEGFDLPTWVQSVVREEWTAEVFDQELIEFNGSKSETEMVQVLQLAMACVDLTPERRPKIEDVVKVLEEVSSKMESSDDPSKGNSGVPSPPANTTP